jgi:hypothetical protein
MNKHIEQWLEQHEREKVNILAAKAAINDVILITADKEVEYVNLYSGYSVSMQVTIKVDSLREVNPLARELAKVGIRVNHEYKVESTSMGKTYYFNLPSTRLDYKGEPVNEVLMLAVHVRGKGEGANCKYVKKGEKTIDIMEWVCSDGTGSTNEADVTEVAPVEEVG